MSLAQLFELLETVELSRPSLDFYKMNVRLDHLLKASFPNKGDAEEVEKLVRNSLEDDSLGLQTRTENGNFVLSYPIALLASEKIRA